MEELQLRGTLSNAVGGRTPSELLPLLAIIAKGLPDTRYTRMCTALLHRVLDTYVTVVSNSVQASVKVYDVLYCSIIYLLANMLFTLWISQVQIIWAPYFKMSICLIPEALFRKEFIL